MRNPAVLAAPPPPTNILRSEHPESPAPPTPSAENPTPRRSSHGTPLSGPHVETPRPAPSRARAQSRAEPHHQQSGLVHLGQAIPPKKTASLCSPTGSIKDPKLDQTGWTGLIFWTGLFWLNWFGTSPTGWTARLLVRLAASVHKLGGKSFAAGVANCRAIR